MLTILPVILETQTILPVLLEIKAPSTPKSRNYFPEYSPTPRCRRTATQKKAVENLSLLDANSMSSQGPATSRWT